MNYSAQKINFISASGSWHHQLESDSSRWERTHRETVHSVSHTGIETSFCSPANRWITLHWAQSGCIINVSSFCLRTIRYHSVVCSHWLVRWRINLPVESLVRWWIRWRRLFVCKKIKASHVIRNTRTIILTDASPFLTNTYQQKFNNNLTFSRQDKLVNRDIFSYKTLHSKIWS